MNRIDLNAGSNDGRRNGTYVNLRTYEKPPWGNLWWGISAWAVEEGLFGFCKTTGANTESLDSRTMRPTSSNLTVQY